MRIDVLTLFPQMFGALQHSIIRRAVDKKLLEINLIDFRKYTKDKHNKVDDTAFGGGAGMVLTAQPIVDCVESVDPTHSAHRIFLTPAAAVLTQKRITEIAKFDRILLLCGHYEGVDQRAVDLCFDECISIGEYVLTGGEIPAMVLIDAVARYVPGVINPESLIHESYSINSPSQGEGVDAQCADGVVWEHPQYTKPRNFRGHLVPEVLLNGNHSEIERWKNAGTKKH